MAETEIRINRRTLERSLFTVIIIALAVVLILRWDAPITTTTPTINVSELQADNAALEAQITTLEADVAKANAKIELLEEAAEAKEATPAPTPKPEDTLSGEFDMDWTVTMNGARVERVLVVAVNGLDKDMRGMYYQLHWKFFNAGTVRVTEEFSVDSGDTWTKAIVPDDGNIISRQEDDDVLILEVFDKDGELVTVLEQDV